MTDTSGVGKGVGLPATGSGHSFGIARPRWRRGNQQCKPAIRPGAELKPHARRHRYGYAGFEFYDRLPAPRRAPKLAGAGENVPEFLYITVAYCPRDLARCQVAMAELSPCTHNQAPELRPVGRALEGNLLDPDPAAKRSHANRLPRRT